MKILKRPIFILIATTAFFLLSSTPPYTAVLHAKEHDDTVFTATSFTGRDNAGDDTQFHTTHNKAPLHDGVLLFKKSAISENFLHILDTLGKYTPTISEATSSSPSSTASSSTETSTSTVITTTTTTITTADTVPLIPLTGGTIKSSPKISPRPSGTASTAANTTSFSTSLPGDALAARVSSSANVYDVEKFNPTTTKVLLSLATLLTFLGAVSIFGGIKRSVNVNPKRYAN